MSFVGYKARNHIQQVSRRDAFARVAAELERMGDEYERTPRWRVRWRADLRSGMRQIKAQGAYFMGPGLDDDDANSTDNESTTEE